MTIREKLKEIKNSKITTERWVFVHNTYGDGRGMFLSDLRDDMELWSDDVLNAKLVECRNVVRESHKCIFLEY